MKPKKIAHFPQPDSRRFRLVALLGAAVMLAFAWLIGRAAGGQGVSAFTPVAHNQPMLAEHGLPERVNLSTGNAQAGRLPRAVIANRFHDFGALTPDRRVRWVFTVANHGQADLIIRRAYTTCSCTLAEITASVIPPGQVSRVTVEYDPSIHTTPGATVRRGVILETNDPDQPTHELWIQARIR